MLFFSCLKSAYDRGKIFHHKELNTEQVRLEFFVEIYKKKSKYKLNIFCFFT